MASVQTAFLSDPTVHETLENGLSVIFLPIQHSNVLALQLWVKTGSIHEGHFLGSGVSHFVEHMVFKGTETRDYEKIFKEAQQQGAKLNAYTTFDRTVFTYDACVNSLDVGLDLLRDMTLRATFPEEEFQKEREVILREIAMCKDDADDCLSECLFEEAFRRHPYRYPVIGVKGIFEQLTREDVRRYWHARYAVNNMTLVVAGNLPQEAVFEKVRQFFGTHKPRSVTPVLVPKEPLQLAERSGRAYGDYQIVRGAIGFRIPGLGHKDGAKLQVLATVAGGGESSLLYRELREKQRLVQTIEAASWMGDTHGLFIIQYACEAGKREAVETYLHEHLTELVKSGLTRDAVAKTYRQALLSELDARKTVSGQAHHVGWASVCLGDAGYTQRYLEQLRTLKVEDVCAIVDTYLTFAQSTCVSLEPLTCKPSVTNATVVVSEQLPLETETVNGVRILYQPCAFPKTHIEALFSAGALYEPSDKRGLSQLLATMLTKDTEQQSALEVAEAVEALGGQWNGFAGNNYLGLSAEVLSTDAANAVQWLQNALTRPRFVSETFGIERNAQISELKAMRDDAFYVGFQRLRQEFFKQHPYAVGSLGTEEGLRALTVDDCRRFYASMVSAENTVLSVVSSLPKERILKLLDPLCAALPKGHFKTVTENIEFPSASRIEEPSSKEQAMVFAAYPMSGYGGEDFYVGEFLEELFNGLASTFVDEVREKRGLAYTVGATRLSGKEKGMFCLFAGTHAEATDAVETEMARAVQRVLDRKLTKEEFETARTSLKVNRQLGLQSIGKKAFAAAYNALLGLPNERWLRYEEAINSMTLDLFYRRCENYLRSSQTVGLVIKSS